MKYPVKIFLFFTLLFSSQAMAQVKYDEGAVYIKGLTFLQSSRDTMEYYYLPQFPRLATRSDGTFEFLCLKYTSAKTENSGGLLHALVEFSIPDSLMKLYEKELQKIVSGAKIRGAVPLMESKATGDENIKPGFEIVSAVLSSKDGKDAMTRTIVTSGYAPFTPGSKAAVAALLNPVGSTLLWNSFTGPASDVSVAVNGYYEAVVRAYNAVVTAEMSVVYSHLSKITNTQSGYNKNQVRQVVDEMIKNGVIKVDVFDRSTGLGVKTSDMDGILSLVTTKVTEIMFDTKTGWSKEPERVDPNLGFRDQGKQEDTGLLSNIAKGIADINNSLPILGLFSPKRDKNYNPQYRTDNQYILKDIKDVRSNKFYLNLSKSTTIKVPFHTAGNLGGLYAKLGDDSRYFRIVNIDEETYQRRNIIFQVDGDFVDAFDDVINFVTVNFRKKYSTGGHSDVTAQLLINGNDLKNKISIKDISYPRLGIKSADWLEYEYQLLWSFKGRPNSVRIPENATQWIKSSDPAVSLIPPLVKEYVELDADRREFLNNGVASASINFATKQAGAMKVVRTIILRADDKSSINKVAIYHDAGVPVGYQSSWFKNSGKADDDVSVMASNYLFLSVPPAEKFIKKNP
ncbi:MAG: hypothetical protein SGI96_20780 [Bacteroidota bacterium]|nr:hypothetical protein [Bacteroidota bacterium]